MRARLELDHVWPASEPRVNPSVEHVLPANAPDVDTFFQVRTRPPVATEAGDALSE